MAERTTTQERTRQAPDRQMLTVARAEALFASTLSASEPHDADELKAAIAAAVRDYNGVAGCAAHMATEFGEHPEQAARRMLWACGAVQASRLEAVS